MKEVDTDLVYHYTKKSKKQNARDGELLFSFEAVRERQDFAGSIRGRGKHLRILGRLLEQGELRFGKSRSSPVWKMRTEWNAEGQSGGSRDNALSWRKPDPGRPSERRDLRQ